MFKMDKQPFLKNIRRGAVLWCSLVCLPVLQAQSISGINTRWSDSFVEWDIYETLIDSTDDADAEPYEAKTGGLQLRWLNLRDDWSEWDYELGEERGTIKVKWKNDPSQWELRTYDGSIVTMRTAWKDDLSEWRVTDNTVTLILKSRWANQFDEWVVEDAKRGQFYMYTVRRGDPRDWNVRDQLDGSVSQPMRMALVFLTAFVGSPRQ
jgi:hypothetical protein